MRETDEIAENVRLFREKMRAWGQSELSARAFEEKYLRLASGNKVMIPEEEIEPVASLPHLEDLGREFLQAGAGLLQKAVLIKLNGGLGTGMGMERAKSLLPVKQGLSFLDIIVKHAGAQGAALILMNSHRTRRNSLALVRKYPHIREQEEYLPLDFEQSMIPKVDRKTLRPAEYLPDPDLEWCPPGHGELFTAIHDQGLLARLLDAGYEYAFISNADNLCASLHPRILGYLSRKKIPFLMEVTRRTSVDRKGGHLARTREDGSLLLRESAQCPKEDLDDFLDIDRHRFFNTNNLWVRLESLRDALEENDGLITLPLIRNEKTVNPLDPASTPVFQLESAMGSAISFFPGAEALEVPRGRFLPVKNSEDLLVVRSDRIVLIHDDYTLTQCRSCRYPEIRVTLDDRYYKYIEDFERYFPGRVPSLRDCTELTVEGPFIFRDNVIMTDKVTLVNRSSIPAEIPEGAELSGFYLE